MEPRVDVKVMSLRYDGICSCGAAVTAGTRAGYDRVAKRVVCPGCLSTPNHPVSAVGQHESAIAPPPAQAAEVAPSVVTGMHAAAPPSVEPGRAGASAIAEFERRSAKREATIRARHPKLGGLILALSDDPSTTRVWKTGGIGEQKVGAALDGLGGDSVLVLHDRKIPGSRANIDHIAVGPAGIFVIDAKRYVDAKVEVRRSGGLLSPVTERLVVRGRDQTKLVAGLAAQVSAVYEVLDGLAEFAHIEVQAVLTFVDANLPIFSSLEIAGIPVLGLKGTVRLVRRPGPLDDAARATLHSLLASRLVAYSS
jgi:hypothetical protein